MCDENGGQKNDRQTGRKRDFVCDVLTNVYLSAILQRIDEHECEAKNMQSKDVALICKALGDANRPEIVKMLSDGEKCACKLLERFEITQPTLSHHMKILVSCGLVNDRREGKWHFYTLNCETLAGFKAFIEGLECCTGGCGEKTEGGCCCGGEE